MGKKNNNIVFLLDETGSMESCKSDTIGGFNQFLKDQQKGKNNIKFSLTLFNSSKIEKKYTNENIKNVEPLSENNYKPSNLTPLWDAIGTTINELPKTKNVLFVILTDGQENSSKEFKPDTVKNMIKENKKNGWNFLFLGADLDTFSDAHNIGIDMNFKIDKVNMKGAYRSLSNTVTNYCSTGKVDYQN